MGKRNRILIVDDREESLRLLRTVLEGGGCEVVTAAHGAEALEQARKDPPDLVISDVLLPVMDGFALCREWKNDEQLKSVPFVFYTAAYAEEPDREFGLKLGAEQFIVKPQEPGALLALIRETIGKAGTAPAKPVKRAPAEKEAAHLKSYDERLVRKLEAKVERSEQAKREVAEEMARLKQTEEERRASEDRLRTLVEKAPMAIGISRDGMTVYVNQKYLELYGFRDRKDVDGEPVTNRWAPEFRGTIQERIQKRLSGEPLSSEFEGLGRRSDGSTFPVHVAVARVDLADGPAVMAFLTDITARKLAEAAHARLAAIVNSSEDAIIGTTLDGIITTWNTGAEKLFGHPAAEAVGKPVLMVVPPEGVKEEKELLERIKRGESVTHFETVRVRKDGKRINVSITISPITDDSGKIVGASKIARDITGHKQLEAQFRQVQKMEAIGRLAGGVAHDFNNILAVIQMVVDLLKATENITPEQVEYANDIGKASERAATLTRQLLVFGRQNIIQLCNLDLNECINNLAKMLRRILGEDIQLQFNMAAQPMFIHADPGMVDQVIMNLAVNSRDAMLQGGKLIVETATADFDELTASQSSQARPGAFVCLSVSDTGCGIPPESFPRIFEPFFTTKEIGRGSGLGLATVFGIIQQHQGWINVYSELGRGTTFRIYIPRLVKLAGEGAEPRTLANSSGGSETILLVEDDLLVSASLSKALTKLGYRVFMAGNGIEALGVWKLHRDEIHLLLTDLVMPGGMSGRELSRQLLEDRPDLKVIYASGYSAEVAGKDLALKEGVNFLSKPFQAHKLAQVVRSRLDNRS